MINCDVENLIELTDSNIATINRNLIVGYVIIKGNPWGCEGYAYIFTIESNEMKTYRGNIYYDNLKEENFYGCVPKDLTFIPYYMGHYVYVPDYMAETVKSNWEKYREEYTYPETRMIKGIYEACKAYEDRLIGKTNVMAEPNSNNILVTILNDYPDVWKQPNRFKALLMDLIPQDKLRRNLLYICVEEQIPNNLSEKTQVNNIDISVFRKKVIGACGCSDSLAEEIIAMWIEALGICVTDISEVDPKEILIDDLELSVRTYNCLKRAGINKLGDLVDKLPDDGLMKIRNLGRKSLEEILTVLKKYNLILGTSSQERETEVEKKPTNSLPTLEELCDQQEIGVRTYNCLRRAGITTLEEVAEKTYEDMLRVRNLGRRCLDEVIRVLDQYGLKLKEPEKPELDANLAEMSLEDMELSVRSYNCLRRAGVNKLQDIIDLSGEDFIKVRNLGLKSAQEIVEKLAELGVPYELRKHLNKAIADRKEARLKEKEEKEQREKEEQEKEEEESSSEDFLARLKSLQITLELKQGLEKIQNEDYAEFLVHFEKAVELGYRGNYSLIGQLYLAGVEGVPKDYAKGFKWLQRFYDDFKAGNLELDDNSMMIEVCHNLGALYFVELQKGNFSTVLKQHKLKNVLDIWKEAINYAPEEKDEDDSESKADKLLSLGCCFYYGKIRIDDVDDMEIQPDYEYAYKAFVEAERLKNVTAITLLAEMYEEGKFVEQNEVIASNKYLKAAIKGEENAVEWCQKHFLDELPWDKQSNWSDVVIAEEFPEIIAKTAKQIECNNLEDLRKFEFENLKDLDLSIEEAHLRRLFVRVANFVENYEPSPDAGIRSVIGLVDVANTLAQYGYEEPIATEVSGIFGWLNEFYEGYLDETVQLSRGYDDISRIEYRLGICYAYGIGTGVDLEKAVDMLSKTILHGKDKHYEIVLSSSKYLYCGEISAVRDKEIVSINPDYKQAYRGFKKLSTKGQPEATYYLAQMFEEGKYVEQDLRQAIKLYKDAAAKGNTLAEQWLEEKDF